MDVITSFAFAALVVIPLWRIFERAGMTPAIALVAFVPVVGIVIVAAILAFAQWHEPYDDRQPDLFDGKGRGSRR